MSPPSADPEPGTARRRRAGRANAPDHAPAPTAHAGWHTRGYLPHFDAADIWQAITYRLADSMPSRVVAALDRELSELPEHQRSSERRRRIDRWLDSGHGTCLLKRHEVAALVLENWQRFAGERYDIGPWVIMPNHVHIMIRVNRGFSLETVVRSWKSYTAKRIMAVTGCQAPVWWNDYWDRFIRDEAHWRNTRSYIERNPVAAGLVATEAGWPWSSAVRESAPAARGPRHGHHAPSTLDTTAQTR